MSRLLAQSYNDIDAFDGETDLSNLIQDASTYANFQIEVSVEPVSGAASTILNLSSSKLQRARSQQFLLMRLRGITDANERLYIDRADSSDRCI